MIVSHPYMRPTAPFCPNNHIIHLWSYFSLCHQTCGCVENITHLDLFVVEFHVVGLMLRPLTPTFVCYIMFYCIFTLPFVGVTQFNPPWPVNQSDEIISRLCNVAPTCTRTWWQLACVMKEGSKEKKGTYHEIPSTQGMIWHLQSPPRITNIY